MMTVMGMAFRSRLLSAITIAAGLAFCGKLVAQSPLLVTGEPQWEVQNGLCKFTLAGETKIINQGPSDYLSGSLRLSLVMTANPFPDAGSLVSVVDMGQLQGGYEFSNASTSAPMAIPAVTGFRFFTLALEEFMGNGWFTHYGGRSQLVYLYDGVAGSPPPWKPPTGRVIPLPDTKPGGLKVVFTQKAIQLGGRIQIVPQIDQFSISAKLGRSGRTVAYRSSITKGSGADWSYKSGRAKWNGKSYRVGVLVFDFGVEQGKSIKSTYWLFFQKNGRGFYKATHVEGKNSFTTWGMFTLG